MPLFTQFYFRTLFFAFSILCVVPDAAAQLTSQPPQWNWASKLNSATPGWVITRDMAVDAAGNSYLVGYYSNPQTFGDTTLTTSDIDHQNGFVVKLSPTGRVEWARAISGADREEVTAVACDAAGNVYITGSYSRQIVLGSFTLTTPHPSAYIAKYDAAGNVLWAQQSTFTGTNCYGTGSSIAVDNSGNVFIAGNFVNNIRFGSISLSLPNKVSSYFLTKYDGAGNVQWAVQDGGTNSNNWYLPSVAIGPDGSPFLSGTNSVEVTYGTTHYSIAGTAATLVKYSPAGQMSWLLHVPSTGSAQVSRGAIDAMGNVYFPISYSGTTTIGDTTVTSFYSAMALAKVTADGTIEWVRTVRGRSGAHAAVDAAGNVHAFGHVMGDLTLGSTTYSNAGSFDGMLISYTPQGQIRWATTVGGNDIDGISRMGFDADGHARIMGEYSNVIRFGSTTLTAGSSNENWFVAQLEDPLTSTLPLATLTAIAPSSGSPGQVVTLTGSGFVGVQDVLFNGTPASSFKVQSATSLEAMVPMGATTGPVSVRTSAGLAASVAVVFQPTTVTTASAPALASLGLYPNPASTTVHLPGLAAGSCVQLLDMLGHPVRTATLTATQQVAVSGLAPGIYTLRASDPKGQQYISRLVVQ
jgi:hypothetical protein